MVREEEGLAGDEGGCSGLVTGARKQSILPELTWHGQGGGRAFWR